MGRGRKPIEDGLTNWQRYRLRDIEGYRKRKRDYARTNLQQIKYRREYMRKWTAKNRDKYNAWAREYHKKNGWKYRARVREAHLRRKFGITTYQYEQMLKDQNGVCAICKKNNMKKKGLNVDHDHQTKKIRGILCSNCNGSLGWYEVYKPAIQKYLG